MEISHLYKSFGEKKVFEDFNATIKENSITFLKGQTGSGKTTLINLLLGIIKPDKGEITGFLGKKISVVFQENRLFLNRTLLENLYYVTNSPINADLLKRLDLTQYKDKKLNQLSGGTIRRISLFRALSVDYDILFLDEPFTGLDNDVKMSCMDVIIDMGKTVIISTHDDFALKYFSKKRHIDILEVNKQ